MPQLVTVSTGSFYSIRQTCLDLLCLARRNLLAISVFHRSDDVQNIRIQIDIHDFRHGLEEELELSRLRSLDILMRPDIVTRPKRLTGMVIIARRDLRISPSHTVIRSNAKRTAWA